MNTQWCKSMLKKLPEVEEKKRNKFAAIALAVLGSLFSINLVIPDGDDLTTNEIVESQRATAKANVLFNARNFQHTFQHYNKTNIVSELDYSINEKCISGDGWGGATLVKPNGGTMARLMCSTTSASIGCLVKSEFDKVKYAIQEGVCNLKLSTPLVPLTN